MKTILHLPPGAPAGACHVDVLGHRSCAHAWTAHLGAETGLLVYLCVRCPAIVRINLTFAPMPRPRRRAMDTAEPKYPGWVRLGLLVAGSIVGWWLLVAAIRAAAGWVL